MSIRIGRLIGAGAALYSGGSLAISLTKTAVKAGFQYSSRYVVKRAAMKMSARIAGKAVVATEARAVSAVAAETAQATSVASTAVVASEAGAASQVVVKEGVTVGKQIWPATKTRTSVRNAFEHWKDHKNEFPGLQNAKQYVEKTWEFLKSPPNGTLSKYRSNGDRILYHPESNTFGVESIQNVPKTMFKPNPNVHGKTTNLEYFHGQ